MRKLFTILALLGLAVGISAQGARADTVTALGPDPTLSFSVPLSSPITMGSVNLFSVDVTFSSPASTPEPSSLMLLGGGFLALGGIARRRLIARFN